MGFWRYALVAVLLLAAPIARADPLAQAVSTGEPARLALVIGNADYNLDGKVDTPQEVSRQGGFAVDLPNARNDAADMKDALERLHFTVSAVNDATLADMNLAIAKFGSAVKKAGPNTIAIVYYSGHGIAVDGETYLIPAGSKLPNDQDFMSMDSAGKALVMQGYAVPLGNILSQLPTPGDDGANLIILDACRDDPWETRFYGTHRSVGSEGNLPLAETSLPRTVIAFATSPGAEASDGKGRHSPYTETLLAWIENPGLSVVDMFVRVGTDVTRMTGQTPRLDLSSIAPICLAGCSDHTAVTRAVAPKAVQETVVAKSEPAHDSADDTDFKMALTKATAEDLLAYAVAHPDSSNAPTALKLYKAMKGAPANNQAEPAKTESPAAKEPGSVRQAASKSNGDH